MAWTLVLICSSPQHYGSWGLISLSVDLVTPHLRISIDLAHWPLNKVAFDTLTADSILNSSCSFLSCIAPRLLWLSSSSQWWNTPLETIMLTKLLDLFFFYLFKIVLSNILNEIIGWQHSLSMEIYWESSTYIPDHSKLHRLHAVSQYVANVILVSKICIHLAFLSVHASVFEHYTNPHNNITT